MPPNTSSRLEQLSRVRTTPVVSRPEAEPPAHVSTHDLVTLPFPTRFGRWRIPVSQAPFLFVTNRPVTVCVHGTRPTFTHGSMPEGVVRRG